jgi:alpha-tubulin suppressor-like RCC1 family protein
MMWGYNNDGQLGDNTIASKSSPIQTIAYGANWKQASAELYHIAAVKTDGTLWCWGRNLYGQLGDNTTVKKSSPIQTTAFGTNWKQVACGYQFTAAIKADGTLWTWGANSGQIGDNTVTPRSSPVQTVAFGTNWKQVACGSYHMAAIKTDGTLWSWGFGTSGQLGDNAAVSRSSPVQTVTFGTNWKQVACGDLHTAATKQDGTLWVWGYNKDNSNTFIAGQLGDNSGVTARSSPVQTVAFGTNWKQVTCNQANVSAVKTDGTLWSWGFGTSGQLGDNAAVSRSSPVQTVAFGTNWKQATCGWNNTFGIKIDGTLWSWGTNTNGGLGDNTITNRSSPVQTILYGNTWKSIISGNEFTAAIKDGDF